MECVTESVADPGSFKDPIGSVQLLPGCVRRTCAPHYREEVQELLRSAFFTEAVSSGMVLQSVWLGDHNQVEQPLIRPWTYPYEWSFSMLKDAALLTLELEGLCLENGHDLKDASAYNVAFTGGRPVFADVFSVAKSKNKLYWEGHKQFCREFLAPLLLQSQAGVPFHAVYRGSLNGIPLETLARLLPLRQLLRPGIFLHVWLQAWLERRYSRPGSKPPLMGESGLKTSDILTVRKKQLDKLKNFCASLKEQASASVWSSYGETHSYSEEQAARKKEAVTLFLNGGESNFLVDYGANVGTFSAIAAKHCAHVFAVDSDPQCIEKIYQQQKQGAFPRNVSLCVADLTNPSPGLGWENLERKALSERLRGGSFFALALVHHLRFNGNLPARMLAKYFADNHRSGIIEYVAEEDEMVRHLLRHRQDFDLDDYREPAFEAALSREFIIERVMPVTPTRKLYFLTSRGHRS